MKVTDGDNTSVQQAASVYIQRDVVETQYTRKTTALHRRRINRISLTHDLDLDLDLQSPASYGHELLTSKKVQCQRSIGSEDKSGNKRVDRRTDEQRRPHCLPR